MANIAYFDGLFTNITTSTTTTVKNSAGLLHCITMNTPLASGMIVIYDSKSGSGTVIGTITNPGTLLTNGPMTAFYDVQFNTALTIVSSGANQDITVSYH